MPQEGFESKPLAKADLEGFESKPLDQPKSTTQQAGGIAKDVAIGASKGAGSTITNLGALARKIPGVSSLDKLMTPIEFSITPTNFSQQVGKTGEQIGEFFLPGSMIGKAETALVGLLPKGKWALALARGVPEAAAAYGVSKAQGDPNAKTSAAMAGSLGAFGKVISKAGPALQASAEHGVGKAFQATDKRMAALAKKVAPEVLSGQHGSVWSLTMRGIEDRAEKMTASIGEKIEEQIQQYGKLNFSDTVDGIVNHLEQAKDAYRVMVPADQVLAKTGELAEHAIMFDAGKVRQLTRLQRTLQDLKEFDAGTLENLIGARRAWDEVVSSAGGFAERGRTGTRMAAAGLKDKTEAWAKREGVRAIRQVLSDPKHTDLKKLQALNAQYSFWVTVQDLSEGALNKHQDQAGRVIKALGVATGAILGEQAGQSRYGAQGGIVGGTLGALAGGASAGGFLGRQIVEAVRSPAFRLASAQVKHQIAEAIMSGKVDVASRLLGRFTGAVTAGTPASTPDAGRP